MTAPRILIYDIENAPSHGWTWGKWQQNVIDFTDDWFLLCFAYKWFGESTVRTVALPDFPTTYDSAREVKARLHHEVQNDEHVTRALWKLFDEADIVIAHNGDSFDQAKARAKFVQHGLNPPSPFREIDTKKIASRHFRFESNSLKDLCRFLRLTERKSDPGGWQTWAACMDGDPAGWRTMLKYNKQDVQALEELYLKLRPWAGIFPNLTGIEGADPTGCPKCQAPREQLIKNGWRYLQVTRRQAWRCKSCGGTCYTRKTESTPAAFVN